MRPIMMTALLSLSTFGLALAQTGPEWMPRDERWMEVRFVDGGYPKLYVDTTTVVVSEEGLVKVWVFMGKERSTETTAGPWDNGRLLQEYDCEGRRYRALVIHGYVGTRFSFADESSGSWIEIAPESADEALLGVACRLGRTAGDRRR